MLYGRAHGAVARVLQAYAGLVSFCWFMM